MKRIIIILTVLISSIIACSVQDSLVANGASYTNWVGGQEGVGGTNFVFNIINKSNIDSNLDSIYIDGVKVIHWEQNSINDTIIIKSSINQNNINNSHQETSNYRGHIKAVLFFSTVNNNFIMKFNKIKRKENIYYP